MNTGDFVRLVQKAAKYCVLGIGSSIREGAVKALAPDRCDPFPEFAQRLPQAHPSTASHLLQPFINPSTPFLRTPPTSLYARRQPS